MRFYKPGQTQYQSQFAPLNLDFMQKSLAQKEANDAIAEDLLDKTSQLQVEGGMLSDPNEVKKYNDWIQSNTAAIRDKFYSGELDAKEAARNLNKISQFYNTNEDIKFFNADKQLSANTRTRIAQGKANNALSSNISYLNGQINTTPISSKEGLDALARGHNLLNPTSITDKENFEPHYKDLKGSLFAEEWGNANGLNIQRTADGIPYVVNTKTGKMDEALTWKMVYDKGLQFAEDELRNSAKPYVQYNQLRYKDKYTPEQLAREFANNFTGTYTKHTESTVNQNDVLEGLMDKEGKTNKFTKTPLSNHALAGGTVTNTEGIEEIAKTKNKLNRIINGESTGGGVAKPRPGAASTGPGISVGTSVTFADLSDKELDLVERYYRAKGEDAVVDNILTPARKGGKDMLKAITAKFPMKKGENKDWDKDGLTPLADALKEMDESGYLDANLAVTTFDREPVTQLTDPSILGIQGKEGKNLNLADVASSMLSQNISIIDGKSMSEFNKDNSAQELFDALGYELGTDNLANIPVNIVKVGPANSLRVGSKDKSSWGNAVKITALGKDGKYRSFYVKDFKQSSTNPNPEIRQQEDDQIAYEEQLNNLINEIHSLKFEPTGVKVPLDNGENVYAIRKKENGNFVTYWASDKNPNKGFKNSEALINNKLGFKVSEEDYVDLTKTGKK